MSKSILIQGIGAMGGVSAAKLIAAGFNPTLVAGSEKNAAAITTRGITLIADNNQSHYPAQAFPTVESIPGNHPFDLFLIFTKASAVVTAANQALPRLHEDSIVIALQNGIVEPTAEAIVGPRRVIPSLCNWAATMHEPGVYEHTVSTLTVLGERSGEITPRLREIETILTHITPVQLSANILGAQWSKLAINCAGTTLGAVLGCPIGGILSDPRGRALFVAIYREVNAVANAANIRLEKVVLDPIVPTTGSPDEIETWLDFAHSIYAKSRPSLLQDLERNKPTETDFIAGHVEKTAQSLNTPAPLCAALNRMIHECERAQRNWDFSNIDELTARIPQHAPE